MKVFEFRLETLLSLRKSKAIRLAAEYGKAIHKAQALKEKRKRLMEEEARIGKEMKEMRETLFNVEAQEWYLNKLGMCSKDREFLERAIARAKEDASKLLHEYMEMKKEEQALETLKEKQFGLYMKEVNRREDRVLEEIVHARIARRKDK